MARPKAAGRREELLDAALVALAERGIAGMRIKDVADQAGVSTGTVHYHFNDIEELIVAIHEMAVERFCTSRRELAASIPDARDRLVALAETGIPSSSDDPLVASLYELGLANRRMPIHRAFIRSLYEQQVAVYAAALEVGVAQGSFSLDTDSRDLAAIAVALEDSLGLHILTGNMPVMRARELLLLNLSEITNCSYIRDQQASNLGGTE